MRKSVEDWEVCEICHLASNCKECCRKCDKKNCKGSEQACGLTDTMRLRVIRVNSWKHVKKGGRGMAKMGTNQKQKEFGNMPERTDLGKKAIEYVNVVSEIASKEAEKDKIKAELIELFLASGKTAIKVENHIISYSHRESDSVKVKVEG